ncbi:MAG: MBL fold metallo-hydrolase [Chloroflexi bacterium]|nr:MBL fold metallo-hydrolase [Chloroflexota bacterium]
MIEIIDLKFQDQPQIIASYVVRGPDGIALVETGPGSTQQNLIAAMAALEIAPTDITDILLTHIHLDHAGAAGFIARQSGARVHVHHVGAPHMADPSRLLSSAKRIYGDIMDPLWGETLAVPADQLHALADGDIVRAAGLEFTALDTPGHAFHHMAYLFDGICFCGDVAATRLPGSDHVRLPTPPPEINPPLWRQSLDRLLAIAPDRLMLTHFGPVEGDVSDHLHAVSANLEACLDFVRQRWQAGETAESMNADLQAWSAAQAQADGDDPDTVHRYEVVVPSYMQAGGLIRYLKKSAAAS